MSETSPDNPVKHSLLVAALLGEKPWSWHWRYNPALKEHMHALGVVAANYNSLEYTLFLLLYHYSAMRSSVPQWLFALLNNNRNRLMVLSRFAEEHEPDPAVQDRVTHFVTCFDICAENRNFLMHGMTYAALESENLQLQKYSRGDPTKLNYLELSAEGIRKIADEIAMLENFGAGLFFFLQARPFGGTLKMPDGSSLPAPLPDKPQKPNKLNLLDSPARKVGAPRPEASATESGAVGS